MKASAKGKAKASAKGKAKASAQASAKALAAEDATEPGASDQGLEANMQLALEAARLLQYKGAKFKARLTQQRRQGKEPSWLAHLFMGQKQITQVTQQKVGSMEEAVKLLNCVAQKLEEAKLEVHSEVKRRAQEMVADMLGANVD